MSNPRPTTVEILLAYLHHAWTELQEGRDSASALEVEQRLQLGDLRAHRFFEELKRYDLVVDHQVTGAAPLYSLSPKGEALMERVPSLEAAVRDALASRKMAHLFSRVRDTVFLEVVKFGTTVMVARIDSVVTWVPAIIETIGQSVP